MALGLCLFFPWASLRCMCVNLMNILAQQPDGPDHGHSSRSPTREEEIRRRPAFLFLQPPTGSSEESNRTQTLADGPSSRLILPPCRCHGAAVSFQHSSAGSGPPRFAAGGLSASHLPSGIWSAPVRSFDGSIDRSTYDTRNLLSG
jgi:hypothetical protein